MRLGIVCALLIAGSISRSVFAAESLEALVESGQHQAAYELALTQEFEQAGEPRFDFLFGLAALEAGYPQQAVFALERVLVAQPQDHRARLELARAHFILGSYEQAKELFDAVLASDPPVRVKANAQLFLDQIAKRSKGRDHQISANAQLKLGYDTNINSATTVDNITLPIGLVLTLGETSQELSDEFAELDVGASYLKLLRKDMGYFLSASVSKHLNSHYSQFDSNISSLGGGYVYQSAEQSFRVPLQYQYLKVDGEHFRSTTSLGFEWSMTPGKEAQFVLFNQWAQQRHIETEKVRDVNLDLFGFAATREISSLDLSLNFSAYFAGELSTQPGGDHFSRGYNGMSFTTSWKPYPDHEFQLGLSAQKVEHDVIHPAFSVIREDDYGQLSLDWNWRIDPRWRLSIGTSYIKNDSNITIYTYERSQLFTGLRCSF